jgi:MoxR-like ATPase
MLKVLVEYPSKENELAILERVGSVDATTSVSVVLSHKDLATLRGAVDAIYVDEKVKDYLVNVARATRTPAEYGLSNLKPLIEYGASPRATVALLRAAKAHAFLAGRHYVSPEDVKGIAPDVLRHRVRPSFEADAEELSADALVKRVLDGLPVP